MKQLVLVTLLLLAALPVAAEEPVDLDLINQILELQKADRKSVV